MSDTPTADAARCPECSGPVADDPRFTSWCPACEWNLAPEPAAVPGRTARERRRAERRTRREEAARRAVRARVERVYELAAADGSAVRDGSWWGAAALAGAVHLTSLALAAGTVALLVAAPTWPLRVVGVFGLGLVFLIRPRFGRLPKAKDGVRLGRGEAPALFALADRVAGDLGGRPLDLVVVTSEFNAGYGHVGLRRRRVLWLGMPLWAVLTPDQRVALLGHELGHQVNADSRRGLWLRSALDALAEWEQLTRPSLYDQSFGSFVHIVAMMVVRLLVRPFNLAARLLLGLLDRLTTRSGQTAEYRADGLAADLAGTAAALGMLRTLMLGRTVVTTVLRLRAGLGRQPRRAGGDAQPVPDAWAELAGQTAGVPPLERERLLRLSARDLGTVDASHPPTHLRLRMLRERPVRSARVGCDAAQRAAIEAELAPAAALIAADLGIGRRPTVG